jgi:hypothetical protein
VAERETWTAVWPDGRRVEIVAEQHASGMWSWSRDDGASSGRTRWAASGAALRDAARSLPAGIGPPTELLRPGQASRRELEAAIEQARAALFAADTHLFMADSDRAQRALRVALAALDAASGEVRGD